MCFCGFKIACLKIAVILAGYDVPNCIGYILPILCTNTFGMETYVIMVYPHVNILDIVEVKLQCTVDNYFSLVL